MHTLSERRRCSTNGLGKPDQNASKHLIERYIRRRIGRLLVKPFQSTGPIKRTLTASTHCQAVKRMALLTQPPIQKRLGHPSETRQPIRAQNPSPLQNSVDGLLSQVHSLECEWRHLQQEMGNANKHLSTLINQWKMSVPDPGCRTLRLLYDERLAFTVAWRF
ncbi:hypothetical protein SV7mr_23050 [Stieleria bergensis]|uniref:Uncharacterized protein n=1 Tax=Stieleria bergensis TaxID=2528025 RepID=A0A517SUI7_9BACT|nr:hypothetical protein SV7mr_23050 [Planctomycetes bacterium SV_7m_r]